jgi:hypothetical protein
MHTKEARCTSTPDSLQPCSPSTSATCTAVPNSGECCPRATDPLPEIASAVVGRGERSQLLVPDMHIHDQSRREPWTTLILLGLAQFMVILDITIRARRLLSRTRR